MVWPNACVLKILAHLWPCMIACIILGNSLGTLRKPHEASVSFFFNESHRTTFAYDGFQFQDESRVQEMNLSFPNLSHSYPNDSPSARVWAQNRCCLGAVCHLPMNAQGFSIILPSFQLLHGAWTAFELWENERECRTTEQKLSTLVTHQGQQRHFWETSQCRHPMLTN